MKKFFVLILLGVVVVLASCHKEKKDSGTIEVSFKLDEFYGANGDKVTTEGAEFVLLPASWDDNYVWDGDIIQETKVVSKSCRFSKVLKGTYKIGFKKHMRIRKTIQVFPDETTEVDMW